MTQAMRSAPIIAGLFLLGACTTLARIQETEPVRTAKFTGSPKIVAQCIQLRLNGKVEAPGFGEKFVVYDSVKGERSQGLTHYSITIAETGPNQGVVEWRIVRPGEGGDMTDAMVRKYWTPVQDCTTPAKNTP
jgi:hypothetical protein